MKIKFTCMKMINVLRNWGVLDQNEYFLPDFLFDWDYQPPVGPNLIRRASARKPLGDRP